MRALELNSMTASCAPLSTSPFTKALLPLITACCAPLVLPIDPDSSSTSATRVSQWGARAWFAVLGLIVKITAGEARGVPEQPSAA